MRVGYNPNKDKELQKSDFIHQVIVPVHIPHQEDYFKDSFKILKLCLESLFITSHAKTYFTVVNNGSCQEIVSYLNQLHQENKIHELIHTSAIGKLNAILKGLTGHQFELITISDADVLFLNNWQKATYEVFEAFPKAGVVSTTPSSKSFNNHTFNIFSEKLFSKNLKFTTVQDPKALENFAISIGNPNFYKPVHYQKYLTVAEQEIKAVVGAGHFVATYRGDILSNVGIVFSPFSLGGNSEANLLDLPVIQQGYWRLSTIGNYTFHLGNTEEMWMQEIICSSKKEAANLDFYLHPPSKRPSSFVFWMKNKLPEKLFYRKGIRNFFLKSRGLNIEEAKKY